MKHRITLACVLACLSFSSLAEERCVYGKNGLQEPITNTEIGGGTTGPATMADGTVVNYQNVAIGPGAEANGSDNIAVGRSAHAEGDSTIAIGPRAEATGDYSQAIGPDAKATDCYSTAVGTGAEATGRSSTAIGDHAKASGDYSTATGNYAEASGHSSTASGRNAKASGAYSSATGSNSEASGAYSTANGSNALATANNSTALGANSRATHTNSVALGAGSQTTRANEVQVGNRQIGGVQDGVLDMDAVNVRQMRAADAWTLNQANQYSDLGDVWTLNEARNYTDERVQYLDKRISRQGAMNTAMSMMTGSAAAIPGKSKIAVGMGFSNGEPALAVGYQRAWLTKKNRPMALTLGAAFARGERSVGLGLAWGL